MRPDVLFCPDGSAHPAHNHVLGPDSYFYRCPGVVSGNVSPRQAVAEAQPPTCPAYRLTSLSGEPDDEIREWCLLNVGHGGVHDWDEEP